MSLFTQFNPGSVLEIRQIHNKAEAIENKVYWGRSADGSVHQYRGTHEGRLKDETELIQAEDDIKDNEKDISDNTDAINNHEDRITIIETTLPSKADKCFAIAMSIALG